MLVKLLRRAVGRPVFDIWIATESIAQMRRDATKHGPLETGGVLLGYWSRNSLAVTAVVLGGPRARRRRYRFAPDARWQAQRIAESYEVSGRRIAYVGDWHSHPIGSGRPSNLDLSTARAIARSPEARLRRPCMLILELADGGWTPRAFVLDGHKLREYVARTFTGVP